MNKKDLSELSRRHADRLLQGVLKEAFSSSAQQDTHGRDEEARIIGEALKK